VTRRTDELQPQPQTRPSLIDTAVWTWARDRRFPALAEWFNTEVRSGRVLVCELLILKLVRLAPNEPRARELAARLAAFDTLAMPQHSSAARSVDNGVLVTIKPSVALGTALACFVIAPYCLTPGITTVGIELLCCAPAALALAGLTRHTLARR
jgi:hypothetical protein